MDTIRVRCWRLTDTALAVQCIQFPDELRGVGILEDGGDYKISSKEEVQAFPGQLYLSGYAKAKDRIVTTINFGTKNLCDEWIANIGNLIRRRNVKIIRESGATTKIANSFIME